MVAVLCRIARGGAAAAVMAAAVAVAPVAPAPAAAAAGGACPDPDRGVTVVVEFAGLGGGTHVRCAAGDPATGLAALTGAGFGYEFVPRVPGLVCRIDRRPNPCNGAPQDAYWSYWHAPRGGSWTYSATGAGTRNPPAGTVEGWAFGAADPPGVAPPAPPAAPPPPPPSDPDPDPEPPAPADSPPAGGSGDASPPEDAGSGDGRSGDGRSGDRGAPGDGAPTGEPTTPAGTGAPSSGPAGGAASPGDPAPGRSPGAGTDLGLTGRAGDLVGSPVGALVTAGLVAALAAGGLWVARRRTADGR